jgi:hypothetical protein
VAPDERAAHRELRVAGQPGVDGLLHHPLEDWLRDPVLTQPRSGVREERVVEHVVRGRQVREPAEQAVGLEPPLPLVPRADRVRARREDRRERWLGRDARGLTSLGAT